MGTYSVLIVEDAKEKASEVEALVHAEWISIPVQPNIDGISCTKWG